MSQDQEYKKLGAEGGAGEKDEEYKKLGAEGGAGGGAEGGAAPKGEKEKKTSAEYSEEEDPDDYTEDEGGDPDEATIEVMMNPIQRMVIRAGPHDPEFPSFEFQIVHGPEPQPPEDPMEAELARLRAQFRAWVVMREAGLLPKKK